MKVNFNQPNVLATELKYIKKVLKNQKLTGDAEFTQKCHSWFEKNFDIKKALLTTSCSTALDMCAILSKIKKGDEVIMSSFTFVTTANAFALRGAKIVFVDIRPDTMNLDEKLIEQAITKKTKVIVPMHYAGVACKMDKILDIGQRNNLIVVEDAAQAVMAKYKDKYLGTLGDLGTYSFHETKNYTCGEGGLLCINDQDLIERAEIIREKGTNRSKFYRGEIDKYTWVDIGSSYLASELNAAYLYAQLKQAKEILKNRVNSWNLYYKLLKPFEEKEVIDLPVVPEYATHNGHIFYIKVKDVDQRDQLIKYLKTKDIYTVFHYVPLHSSKAGRKYSRFEGEDKFTTRESERLLRLPMYYGLKAKKIKYVVNHIEKFFNK